MTTKKKKYLTYVAAVLSAMVVLPGSAQEKRIYKGDIVVNPHELRQVGDSLFLMMDIDLSQLDVESKRSLTLIPVLESESGSMEFPPVVVNGKNRHKAYLRKSSLSEKGLERPYAVVRTDNKNTLHYIQQARFEGWMEGANLSIYEDLCGCGGKNVESSRSQVFSGVNIEVKEVYQVQPHLTYIQPQAEEIKRRNEIVEVYLNFKVGSSVILPDLGTNYAEIQKVEAMLREIQSDKNVIAEKVVFRGYASPEGSVSSNLRLSGQRADAMRSYLASKLNLSSLKLVAEGVGEDWEGLKKYLNESSITDRYSLTDIIEQCGGTDACEQKMKTVSNGVPYRNMLKEIYPKLRRTVCRADYTVRGFSVEEGREIIKTRPAQLSLNEMYLVANTYQEGSKEFNDVFETAVRIFPDDDIANLNAAASAINRNDFIMAQRYLDQIKDKSGEAENCQGVLYLLQGDYDKAEQHLEKAEALGMEAASHNIKELEKKKENENLLRKNNN